jgi:biopolymer transport protein ExbD
MLSKGFITSTRKYSIQIDWKNMKTWVAIFVTLGYALSFYLFFVLVREAFRYFTFTSDLEILLVLNPTETNFYNFFTAFIATMTGTSYSVEMFIKTQFQIPGYIRHSISNDFSGLQWQTNYFIVRLGFFYGVFTAILPIYLSFDFYKEYWVLFLLILLVLFFNQWMRYRFFIKNNSVKTMLLFFVGTTIYSLLLCTIPILDIESLNQSVLKNTIGYNYNLAVPPSNFKLTVRRMSLVREISLGYPKRGKTDSAVFVLDGVSEPLTKNKLHLWLKDSKDQLHPTEQNSLTISLYSDKNIAMGRINEFIDMVRENNIGSVIFMTSRFRDGIKVELSPICYEVKPDTSISQPSCIDLMSEMQKYYPFKIRILKNSLFLNDKPSSPQELPKELHAWAQRYPGKYFIDLESDDNTLYQSYISTLDASFKTIEVLRQEYALKHFSKKYDPILTFDQDRELYNTVTNLFPVNLILLSDQERKFMSSVK